MQSKPFCSKRFFLIFTFFLRSVVSQQLALGAGTGPGSCRAFPFRAAQVDWDVCPPELPCCNEYGYCRSREEWGLQNFRDCNGVTNGSELPESVLELENTLGGDPGPGLGGESDFDKRQLQKVGSGSPAQFGSAPRFDSAKGARGGISFGAGGRGGLSFGAGGGISAGAPGGGKASGSFGRVPPVEGSSSSSRGSNRQRRPSGNQVSSAVGSRRKVAAKRRQENSQSSRGSQRSQGSQSSRGSQNSQASQKSSGRQKVERIPAPRNPVQTGFPPRINTPLRKFESNRPAGNLGNFAAEVFSPNAATGIQRPREPVRRKGPSRPSRPSGRRPRPRPSTLGSRQQSKKSSTEQVTGTKSVRNKSSSIGNSGIGSSSSRSKSTGSNINDVKATDLYPLAGYKNTAGYPMNLNAENCPNYPFCYWNPYAAGAKD